MLGKDLSKNIFIWITAFLILSLMFFLNFLSNLYTDIDFFKLDLSKLLKKNKKKLKKITFVIKNDYILLVIVCIIQTILGWIFSEIISGLLESLFPDRKVIVHIILFLFIIFSVLISEVFARYLSSISNQDYSLNFLFLNSAYFLVWLFHPLLKNIIKPRKKMMVNSEKDIIRYVKNLATDHVLEEEEARLVQAAFNFDELSIAEILIPHRSLICCKENMNNEEIEQFCLRYHFTFYPVLNKKKEIRGVFDTRLFFRKLLQNKNTLWQECINKNPTCINSDNAIDELLEIFRDNHKTKYVIIKKNGRFIGIVTLRDIFNALSGYKKIKYTKKNKK